MKSGLNNWKRILIAVCLCMLLVAYAPWETVPNLINADKPFIDLSGSIEDSIGNAASAYEKAHPTLVPTVSPEPTPVISPEPTPEPTPVDIFTPAEDEIKIIIGDEDYSGSGEIVFVNGNKLQTVTDLKPVLSSLEYEEKKIILIDLYAEKETYRAVKTVLDGMGLSYQTETFDDEETDIY
ncbi:MAG: hypothetical protein IKZ73_00395 [Lachnospiraceae bacterium]|nr:hypothetical protein [Lachnospiraceae bacterium]